VGEASANLVNTREKEPQTYNEAMTSSEAPFWKEACIEELQSFIKTGVYDEVEKPKGRRVVDCKWVFRIKRGPDGEILCYKAQLVAKGFTQVEGIDYNEKFAPVAKFTSIHTLLALAAKNDLELHQMDIKTAFLNGELDEEIFMNLLPGFKKPNTIWKLKKGLYGLKQASREWYKRLCTEFEALGFTQCHSDHGVFFVSRSGIFLIIIMYVDDLIILLDSMDAVKELKNQLNKCFEMTDLGEARWILGIEVIRDRSSRILKMLQQLYIRDVLAQFGMSEAHTISMPMLPNLTLQ
jgi:hypothetical protein